MKVLLFVVLTIGIITAAEYGLPDEFEFDKTVKGFRQANFTNLLDHFNTGDKRTYQQRFWYSTDNFDEKNGPIFVYICGEYPCGVQDERMFPHEVSKQYKASFFFVEHRYYGASQPFEDLSTNNLRYLTSRHALADLALFITEVNDKLISDFGGKKRKVVVIGGSYPGALSAWFRAKYPNIADASWASSAVVNSIVDFEKFDYQIYNSTTRSNLYCTGTVQNMTLVFDRMVQQGNREWVDSVKGYFNATHLHDGDFVFYIADMFTLSVQYGGRTELCDFLESLAGMRIEQQFNKTSQYVKDVGAPEEYDRASLRDEKIYVEKPGRQWTYQYCTEFGWFQVPYKGVMMRSELLKHDYWVDYCRSIFGDDITLHARESNVEYGGLDMAASNIYFVNGGEDPWQWAGVTEPQAHLFNTKTDLLQCENCGHCVELYNEKESDPVEVKQSRKDIQKWLKRILNRPWIQDE